MLIRPWSSPHTEACGSPCQAACRLMPSHLLRQRKQLLLLEQLSARGCPLLAGRMSPRAAPSAGQCGLPRRNLDP
ncbi:hypothetical protein SKAU_G00288240 [Synaphobranchus kaupii]|uniref:Uncharacterized protein n=1 Tax=Synaphobranchus kaupii TaxID=118154 RepID=A0A9Q1ET72_SYNKA|nr:hypothetical protein SKAU_G00288240 [Synaphobranchus kaupii]